MIASCHYIWIKVTQTTEHHCLASHPPRAVIYFHLKSKGNGYSYFCFFLNEKMISFLKVLLSNSVFSFMHCFCERDRDILFSCVQLKRCQNITAWLHIQTLHKLALKMLLCCLNTNTFLFVTYSNSCHLSASPVRISVPVIYFPGLILGWVIQRTSVFSLI